MAETVGEDQYDGDCGVSNSGYVGEDQYDGDYEISNTDNVDEDQYDGDYEASNTGYDGNMSEPNEDANNEQQPYVSEDDARQAFLEYADKKCCFSTGPAKEMEIQKFLTFNTYRYCLETFTESRECKWKHVPYADEDVDGPENGPSPDPWEILVEPPNLYEYDKQKVVVPHTSTVQTCELCGGHGRMRCMICGGSRRVVCLACGGSGMVLEQMCFVCIGSGQSLCTACGGSGKLICTQCFGHGRMLTYKQLKVEWNNYIFVFLADQNSEFPSKRFNKVSGDTIFEDEQSLLSPVTDFVDQSINEASQNAIYEHQNELTSCQILRQRHSIEWLPLTKVEYSWKGKNYDYFVYGQENRAYAKNYPKKCCCAVM